MKAINGSNTTCWFWNNLFNQQVYFPILPSLNLDSNIRKASFIGEYFYSHSFHILLIKSFIIHTIEINVPYYSRLRYRLFLI